MGIMIRSPFCQGVIIKINEIWMWNCSVIVTTIPQYSLRQIRARNIIRNSKAQCALLGHRTESLLFKHLQTHSQILTPHLGSSYLLLCNKPPQTWGFLTMHLVTAIWPIKFMRLPISGKSTVLFILPHDTHLKSCCLLPNYFPERFVHVC